MKKLLDSTLKTAFTVYHAAVIYVAQLPAGRLKAVHVSDKYLHLAEFFILGILTCMVFSQTTRRSAPAFAVYLKAAFWGIFMAALTETIQLNVPGRTADPMDFAANLGGMAAAILFYAVFRRFFPAEIPAEEEKG